MGNYKVRIFAIIGPDKAGKSTIIRRLTSQSERGAGGTRDVLLRGGGYLRIEAFSQSIQEADVSPENFIAKHEKTASNREARQFFSYYNMLIALRSDHVNGKPIAKDYLSFFVKNGWILESIVLLSIVDEFDEYASFGVPVLESEHALEYAAEEKSRGWLLGQVRNHFGWA